MITTAIYLYESLRRSYHIASYLIAYLCLHKPYISLHQPQKRNVGDGVDVVMFIEHPHRVMVTSAVIPPLPSYHTKNNYHAIARDVTYDRRLVRAGVMPVRSSLAVVQLKH